METKQIALNVKAEGEAGQITGYGSIFGNEDSYGDVIEPGAFKDSLASRMPKMLWQHDAWEPIGRWTEAKEDDKGLILKGQITTKTSRGNDAYELIKDGALDGLSIGYRTRDFEYNGDTRYLKQVDLYEVSVVTMPANDKALVTSVKAGEMTERDFERVCRELGFDRTAAKIIVASGWKGYQDHLRDAGVLGPEDDQREADELKQLLKETLQTVGGQHV